MASSAPATSAKVVFGVSLVMSLALDLPKFITREPPPCIWFSMKKKMRMTRRNGSQLKIRLHTELLLGTLTFQPCGGCFVWSSCASCWPSLPTHEASYFWPDLVVIWIVCSLSVSSADLTSPFSMRVTTRDVSVWVYALPELAYS